MLELVNQFFDTKNDPEQLDVDQEIVAHLHKMHPATLSEVTEDNGPVVWILLIPTLHDIMQRFISAAISEKQLLDDTPIDKPYDAIYLCSASPTPYLSSFGSAQDRFVEGEVA